MTQAGSSWKHAIQKNALWLRNLPSRTALKVANRAPISRWLGARYDKARDRHRPNLPALSDRDCVITEALETDGVFMTSLDYLGLPGGEQVVANAAKLADKFAPTAREQAAGGKPFIVVPPAWIAADPVIYRFGLHDRLLDIAEAYLGLPVAYDGVAINYTVADGREISTRKWHRDWEDRRMLKIAIYLHEVDEHGGPFQHICRQDTRQNDTQGFNYDLASSAELESLLGAAFEEDIVSCEGPGGTVIFNDTARFFHRGKPAFARDRAALFFSYFASPPRHPFLCERTGLSRGDIARLAEGLPERQRKAALWRSSVPGALRIIPPATI